MTALKLAAFADEISAELDVQIEHCKKNGVTHFELRGVAGKNVLDFDAALRREIKTKLAANGLDVASIGSPIGKVRLDESFDAHFERFKIAVELAEFFDAPFIRIFSYYPAEGTTHGDLVLSGRDEVMRRMRMKVDYLKGRKPILVHENEHNIYGEKGAQCLDLHRAIDSPKFKAAFDFANFVLDGDDPLKNWPLLKPYTAHFHIKDAIAGEHQIVPAGHGDGHIAEILKDAYASGYRGFLTLEPHLSAAGQFSGFSGPDLFKTAVDALRKLCRENGIPL
jgi:sugar phosphate isomerase/epimerase